MAYCIKCGAKLQFGAKYCQQCGYLTKEDKPAKTPLQTENSSISEKKAEPVRKTENGTDLLQGLRSLVGGLLFIVIAVVVVIKLVNNNTTLRTSDVIDQVVNVAQATDEHVLRVKQGHPRSNPTITYGDSFEAFFGAPTWKYFVGTKEGPDEDGDGKPDYVYENQEIVEFTGYCTYQDVKVKALIQFTLTDDETFSATYLSFNEVPQNNLVLIALLQKVFESYNDK